MLFGILGFLFLTIDIAWMVFCRANLQTSVREGARYAAVTARDFKGKPVENVTAIQARVQQFSFGFLTGKNALITVNWYDPKHTSTPLTVSDACTFNVDCANGTGNLVEVSVENYPARPLLYVFHDPKPFWFTARSLDRME
jgi:hypothetical protein